MMNQPLLRVTDLVKSFGERRAVDSISFEVEVGQTLGLIGPNGAGKSTTVNMLCGLLRPDGGQVLINGQPLTPGSSAAKQQIGLVPQDLALIDELSARENLKLFGALYGLKGNELNSRCDAVLELVKLADRAEDKPGTFSGGMKRRLNIAAAMLHDPQLLILDEPTVGVDPQSRNAIFDSLELIRSQGRALIYTSHYMEEVERLADHIVIIDHGKLLANESPAQLHRRLPAQAALQVDLASEAPPDVLAQLAQQPGVSALEGNAQHIHVLLTDESFAITVLNWLTNHAGPATHFATAKTRLEDIFLALTGRRLRD
jgi:ABC-2 type transport system ATP-binding protein